MSKNAFDKTIITDLDLPEGLVSFGGFAESQISEIKFPKSLLHIEPNTLDFKKARNKEYKLELPEKLISFGGFKNWNISEIKFPWNS
nr:hypothetical protein [Mycoplasmopsis bovis]